MHYSKNDILDFQLEYKNNHQILDLVRAVDELQDDLEDNGSMRDKINSLTSDNEDLCDDVRKLEKSLEDAETVIEDLEKQLKQKETA